MSYVPPDEADEVLLPLLEFDVLLSRELDRCIKWLVFALLSSLDLLFEDSNFCCRFDGIGREGTLSNEHACCITSRCELPSVSDCFNVNDDDERSDPKNRSYSRIDLGYGEMLAAIFLLSLYRLLLLLELE